MLKKLAIKKEPKFKGTSYTVEAHHSKNQKGYRSFLTLKEAKEWCKSMKTGTKTFIFRTNYNFIQGYEKVVSMKKEKKK